MVTAIVMLYLTPLVNTKNYVYKIDIGKCSNSKTKEYVFIFVFTK